MPTNSTASGPSAASTWTWGPSIHHCRPPSVLTAGYWALSPLARANPTMALTNTRLLNRLEGLTTVPGRSRGPGPARGRRRPAVNKRGGIGPAAFTARGQSRGIARVVGSPCRPGEPARRKSPDHDQASRQDLGVGRAARPSDRQSPDAPRTGRHGRTSSSFSHVLLHQRSFVTPNLRLDRQGLVVDGPVDDLPCPWRVLRRSGHRMPPRPLMPSLSGRRRRRSRTLTATRDAAGRACAGTVIGLPGWSTVRVRSRRGRGRCRLGDSR